ncbi:nuclear transport factor 2 family protein [Jeotgalibacillus sp. S-D1]|uniref:nuclear transport factor 2 family protein n=1 Tax=Jeotgalibacillus sp. S-D1 TaxID=2552189 RepID=UPI00105A6327|nr:nuclear transport factor 2 family protein [Jeotgalibacillus sp. S-D1]TDL31081.1 nuclear transport factor 2 family protein [Jeotgalibacillus sp. S-D1]
MQNLEKYFDLFDHARTSDKAMDELVSLFSEDIVFVLNGHKKTGIENWKLFVKKVFQENSDIKHMFEGWKSIEGTDLLETPWAVCGKRSSGTVFTQTGKDIAKLDAAGKISYLENIPDNTNMFEEYKK